MLFKTGPWQVYDITINIPEGTAGLGFSAVFSWKCIYHYCQQQDKVTYHAKIYDPDDPNAKPGTIIHH